MHNSLLMDRGHHLAINHLEYELPCHTCIVSYHCTTVLLIDSHTHIHTCSNGLPLSIVFFESPQLSVRFFHDSTNYGETETSVPIPDLVEEHAGYMYTLLYSSDVRYDKSHNDDHNELESSVVDS